MEEQTNKQTKMAKERKKSSVVMEEQTNKQTRTAKAKKECRGHGGTDTANDDDDEQSPARPRDPNTLTVGPD